MAFFLINNDNDLSFVMVQFPYTTVASGTGKCWVETSCCPPFEEQDGGG